MNFREYFLKESEHKVVESGFYAIFVNTRVTCVNLTDKEHIDYYELRNVYDKANNSEYIFPSTRKCSAQVAQDFALSKFRELHPDLYNKRFVKKVKETFAPFIIENDDVYEWRVYFSEDYEGIIALAEIDSVTRKQKAVNHALSQIKNNPDVSRLFNRSIITTESKESLLSLLTDDQTCLTFTILPNFTTKLVPLSVCRDLEKAGIGKEEWEIESMRVEFSTVERLCIHAIKHITSTVRREDILKVVKDYLDELKNIPGQFYARRSGTGLVIAFTVDLLHFKQYKAGNALAAVKDNTEVNKLFKRKNVNESIDNIGEYNRYEFTIAPRCEGFDKIHISNAWNDDSEIKSWWYPATYDQTMIICMKYIMKIPFVRAQQASIEVLNNIMNKISRVPGKYYFRTAASLGNLGEEVVVMFVVDELYSRQIKVNKALNSIKDNTEVNKLFKK